MGRPALPGIARGQVAARLWLSSGLLIPAGRTAPESLGCPLHSRRQEGNNPLPVGYLKGSGAPRCGAAQAPDKAPPFPPVNAQEGYLVVVYRFNPQPARR